MTASPLLRLLVLVLTLVSSGAGYSCYRAVIAKGVAIERNRVLDSTVAAITPRLARVDTVLVRDTVRIRTTLSRLDTLRQIVQDRITDTITVREYITRADSAIVACSALVSDCAAYRALSTAKVAALEQKLAVQPIAAPRSCIASNMLAGLAGAGVGVLSHVLLTHR